MSEQKIFGPLPWPFGPSLEEMEKTRLLRRIPIMVHYANEIKQIAEKSILLINEQGNKEDELIQCLRESFDRIARYASDLDSEAKPGIGPIT